MEKNPQSKSKNFIFQKAFLFKKEKITTKSGAKPAINTPTADHPAPTFSCKKTPTNGANDQISQETKFGLAFPFKTLFMYQKEQNRFTKTPTIMICPGNIYLL